MVLVLLHPVVHHLERRLVRVAREAGALHAAQHQLQRPAAEREEAAPADTRGENLLEKMVTLKPTISRDLCLAQQSKGVF